ncbi:nucleoside diphosphate kinase regulator [Roseinatronobacter sp. S2]|uniref:nucleoside diphosphate kinase regulator n=1 Tax=Roseinatronobacter sp. S2 TaxID=3035471 RepID=UPI00241040F7|nr:nucleoside diphosphate kinase regulator [Roseinatronobacter sp. S2]WFE77227.1 nucleoside diphosphate kinase regulator [Roseinatronobacter sp. S2]
MKPASTPQVRLPKILLDKTVASRLEAMTSTLMRRSPELAERLTEEIARAKLIAPEKLRENVVTIGSEVTYRDMATDRVRTVTLVFPEDADMEQNRISVLTPAGLALLGFSEGAVIQWHMRAHEPRELEIIKVSLA